MARPPIVLSVEDDGLDAEVVSWIEVLLDGEVRRDVTAYDLRAGTIMVVCACGSPTCREPVQLAGRVEARWREGTPPA